MSQMTTTRFKLLINFKLPLILSNLAYVEQYNIPSLM